MKNLINEVFSMVLRSDPLKELEVYGTVRPPTDEEQASIDGVMFGEIPLVPDLEPLISREDMLRTKRAKKQNGRAAVMTPNLEKFRAKHYR